MNRRKRVWFEETNSKLDPGLVEQLRTMRKNAYHASGTQTAEIPIIINAKRIPGKMKKRRCFRNAIEMPIIIWIRKSVSSTVSKVY